MGLCRAGSAPSRCLVPVARTGVWTERSCIGGKFTGPASRSFSFQSVDMGTRLPSLYSLNIGKNHPKQTFREEVFTAAFSGGFLGSWPRAYPRFTGSFLR